MRTVDVAEAQRELTDLIRAVFEGEDVVIVGASGSVRLVAVPQAQPRCGSARGMFTIRDDFDAPLTDFAPYER